MLRSDTASRHKEDRTHMISYRAIIREAFSKTEEAARKIGINPAQYQLLLAIEYLSENGDVNIQAVSKLLCIQHHSAVGLANRAILGGFVTKRRCNKNRRFVILKITEAGREVINKLEPLREQEELALGRLAA